MARAGCYLFVFFLALAVTEATVCYLCNSFMDKRCEDTFDVKGSIKTTTCDSGKCLKTRQLHHWASVSTQNGVIDRGCGNKSTTDYDCAENHGLTSCTCEGNLCNEATVHAVSMATLVFVGFNSFAVRFM